MYYRTDYELNSTYTKHFLHNDADSDFIISSVYSDTVYDIVPFGYSSVLFCQYGTGNTCQICKLGYLLQIDGD